MQKHPYKPSWTLLCPWQFANKINDFSSHKTSITYVVYINNNGERFEHRSHFISTVWLKSKLSVTHVLILEHRDLILDSRNFQEWSLEDQGLSFKFWVEKYYELVMRAHSLKVYTFILRISTPCIGWDSFTFV